MWSSSGSGKKPVNSPQEMVQVDRSESVSPFWRPPLRDSASRRSVTNPAGRDGSNLVVGAAYSHADVLKFDSLNRISEATPPPPRGSSGSTSPPFKSYINFLSKTNDDWKADEDEMLGYEDDDGDDFGLPSLSNMKRRSKRIATQNKSNLNQESLSPISGDSFGRIQARRYSNSADIAAERPASTYPMPKKSEGKILRPQYKDILRDPANALHLINYPSIPSNAPQKEADAINSRITRINKFKRLLQASSISLPDLRALAWSGVPHEVRAMTWQLLLSYLPTNSERRVATLERKRKEYLDGVKQAFERGGTTTSSSSAGKARGLDEAIWHQISIDIPRTNPHIELYSYEATQRSLERILYVWAVRHPASGYVQGINDLVTPFWEVFLGLYITDSDIETGMDPGQLPKSVLDAVEADSFWCLTKLLDGIQDHYIVAQPGIQRQVTALRDLTARIDSNLSKHLEHEGVEFIQFSFRWMNCLLMREISVKNTIRMWDTYLAEEQGFSEFHLYVCAALLVKWSDKLVKMDFQEIMMFLQSLPTKAWTEKDIELLLSEAFIWQSLYKVIADSDDESDSNEHAVSAPPVTITQAQTRSSEHGSLATASTDSNFFQQIFNEQNGAACEKAQQLQRDLEDVPHQSSAMTVPDVPFQRTTRGFYHSSTTSLAEPRMEKPYNAPTDRSSADWAQGTPLEKEQSAVDPWEVPSSAETPKFPEKQLKGYSHKVLDQSHGRVGYPATKDTLSESRWDAHGITESRDKKRRRLGESDSTFSTSDHVDLIMLPSSSKVITNDGLETAAASSIPLPTMPVDADSAFHLRHPSPMKSPQLAQFETQYAVGSSGTATNVNTPRSQMFSTHNFGSMAPEEQGIGRVTKKSEYRNFAMRRDSSPDIISALTPGLDKVASQPEYAPDLSPGPKPDQECCDERDSSAHQPPPQELQSGESDAEFVAHPKPMVKSKKKRGRPKKSLGSDEPLPTEPAASPVSAADAAPAAARQTKKRGRPKKQSAELAIERAPPPAATPVSAGGRNTRAILGQETDSGWSNGDTIQGATKQNAVHMTSEQGAAGEASSVAASAERGQDWAALGSKEKTKDHSASRSTTDRPKDEGEPKEPRQPSARVREEKSGGDKKGSSAQGTAKPLYRVGLSKRFKIAPLLKSVRKP
ncbi:gtpase-activating gyp1 [Trichoderma arundinaceum]|uniref:Gtpase-activating gyp1 n=1 Tax=Trichoderma arundinaceum TaxID=490622 RepID=A0A395NKA9_TRIAR|nr:gtpase-activating gyp1 [Trichoderma arundinaceum]